MKRIIAILLSACLMVGCFAGCGEKTEKEAGVPGAITKRTERLHCGINAHIFELRPVMDPSSTMDYVSDMVGVMGFEDYRLSTPLDALFTVGEGDTLTLNKGQCDLLHQVIEKMSANGIKRFFACSDGPIYPFGYDVTCPGVAPDPVLETEMYVRWMKLTGNAWAMIVTEFPEISHVEPMNEPDHPTGNTFTKQGHQWALEDGYTYDLTDKAHMLVDMQYYVYQAVKAANPKVMVDTAGLTGFGEAKYFLDYMYEAIESGAHPTGAEVGDADPGHYFDYINFHAYQLEKTLDEYFEEADFLYRACERHNDAGRPAILTEWGYTDMDNEGQEQVNAEKMAQVLDMMEDRMPYLDSALVYVLNDFSGYSVSITEDNFGLFTSRGDPDKPSCPKPVAIELYKHMHGEDADLTPLYKYCPELMPK